jgi:signal transduction histidine kinase/ActR/RegA family two-component response regulator
MKDSEAGAGLLVRSIVVALLYFATAIDGLQYAVVGSTVTLIWPPSGIALVAILAFGYRLSFGIAMGAFLANAWSGLPVLLAASIATGNVLEAVAGAFLLQRLASFRNTLERRWDVLALLILSAIFSTTIAASIGAATLTLGGIVAVGEYATVWLMWWLGDMMGVLVVAPPLLVWLSHARPVLSTLKIIEALGLLASLLVASYLIFATPVFAGRGFYPALLVFPFLIWGALRFDHWGATLVTLIISMLAIWGTTHGMGVFADSSLADSLIGWCLFANLIAVTGLLLAASSAEQRRGRVALKNAHDELARQKEAAERANQAKSQFLAAASHDLRQPLHAIGLYAASMRPQVAGREAAITLDKIEAAVVAMENLFCGILDVSKLDAGVVVPAVSSVSVKALLEGLHEDFRQQASAKGLRFRLRYRDARVASDPVLLERILRNLIANALRYTDRGGALITASQRDGLIRFQVWDTGCGIPPKHMAHIFQEFFQVANPRRDRAQGLGLGLAIVDRLARLLEHPLQVRSLPGKGTVFSLDVPISHADPLHDAGDRDTLLGLARLNGQVAVVDDDPMVLDSLATLLEAWGLQVTMAASGVELLEVLEQAPDILITDYRLGEEDGLELAQALRNAYPGAEFQVIVVTGDVSERSLHALKHSGYQVLEKPVRPARLRTLIANLLRLTRRNRQGVMSGRSDATHPSAP